MKCSNLKLVTNLLLHLNIFMKLSVSSFNDIQKAMFSDSNA